MPSNPTGGDVYVQRPLTNFGERFMQADTSFVSQRAMPILPVERQGDLYWKVDRGDFWRVQNTERARSTESGGGGYRESTDSYFAKVYAWHKDNDERDKVNAASMLSLDSGSVDYVMSILMIDREIKFANAYMDPAKWTTTLNVDWTQPAADVVAQFKTAKRTVQLLTGRRPNKLMLGRQAWDTLSDNDSLLSRVSGGATNAQPAEVNEALIAGLLELEAIYVMDAVKNNALEGAADNIEFIGGDNALLYFAPNQVERNGVTAGVGFSWSGLLGSTSNGIRFKRMLAPLLNSERIEGEMAYDYKIVSADLGYMFTSVSS